MSIWDLFPKPGKGEGGKNAGTISKTPPLTRRPHLDATEGTAIAVGGLSSAANERKIRLQQPSWGSPVPHLALKQGKHSVSGRDLFHVFWKASADGSFAPHLSKLPSSLAGFCMSLLPFCFKGWAPFSMANGHRKQHLPFLLAPTQPEVVSCSLLPYFPWNLVPEPLQGYTCMIVPRHAHPNKLLALVSVSVCTTECISQMPPYPFENFP